MRRAFSLLVSAALACGCGPASAPSRIAGAGDVHDDGGRGRGAHDRGAGDEGSRVARGPITLDARWLDGLDVPDARGKRIVTVVDTSGVRGRASARDGGRERSVAVLLADDARGFTVFDGLGTETHSKVLAAPDAPPPAHVEAADLRDAASVMGASRGPTDADDGDDDDDGADVVRALAFAKVMADRGDARASEAILRTLGDHARSVEARVKRAKGTYFARQAVTRHAAGAPRLEVERALAVAARMEGDGAAYARELLPKLRAFDDPDARSGKTAPSTRLDTLVQTRLAALRDAPCEGWAWELGSQWPGSSPLGGVRALGLTAVPALQAVIDDARPTRCIENAYEQHVRTAGRPRVLRLGSFGDLARSVIEAILRGRGYDPTDVECGHDGHDPQLLGLVDVALTKNDVKAAIAIAEHALGRNRVEMVRRLAAASHAEAKAFVKREAEEGPVFLARLEAAKARAARGDAAWAKSLAGPVGDALAAEDASGPTRCDAKTMAYDGLPVLLRFAPGIALATVSDRFAGYGPGARILVTRTLASHALESAADARVRDALLVQALSDTRPGRGTTVIEEAVACREPSPADVAGLIFGKRLGVAYACTMTAPERRLAARAIAEKLAPTR